MEFECAICQGKITRADFDAQAVTLVTGPLKAIAAHVRHFWDGEKKTSDYDKNVKILGFTYVTENNLPIDGKVGIA